MRAELTLTCPVPASARVLQIQGMFDVPAAEKTALRLDAHLPVEDRPWSVGLIVGPSGAGKSSIARELWPTQLHTAYDWSSDRALIDDFPQGMSIREVTGLLSAVGLASPPAWLRPHATLSNGEAFRADVARALAETPDDVVVIDEFTSVVDRQVAQVASHAVQKTVRRSGRQFVAVTCHYDVEDWLQPDWVYDAAEQRFTWRQVQPHPRVRLAVHKCDRSLWRVFARHHYLSSDLISSAHCFAAYTDDGRPVAFTAYNHFPHPRVNDIKMAHRIVVLPDWQGLGIAGRISDWMGQHLAEQGYRYRLTTSHPGFTAALAHSPRWAAVAAKPMQLRAGRSTASKNKAVNARGLDPRSLTTRTFQYSPPV